MGLSLGLNRIPADKRLTDEAVVTLIMQALFTFGSAMSGTFLNLYLWRLTESLWINGLYNIIVFLFTAVGFVVGGKLTKMKDRMFTYRLGIALIALFFLLIVTARERVVEYYAFFAVFFGIAGGFYWTGYWTLMYDVSNDRNRMRFIALNSAISTTAALVAPVLSGAIFSFYSGLRGYVIVFAAAFLIFLLTGICSLRIKQANHHRKTYYLRHMGLLMRKNKSWRKAVYGNLIVGMMQGVLQLLPYLLIYHVLQKEDLVGYFGAALAVVSIAVNYVFSRIARQQHERKYMLWSVIGYIAAACLLLVDLSFVTVVGFMLLHTVCNPIKSNAFDSYFYRLIGELPLKGKLRVESVVVREICWNAGRVLVVFWLICLSGDLNAPWLPWVVIIASASQFLLLFVMEKRGEPSTH